MPRLDVWGKAFDVQGLADCMKAVVILAVFLALSATAFAEDVTVGNQVVSIDFGNASVTTTPIAPFMIGGLSANGTRYTTEESSGRAIIVSDLLSSEPHSILVSNCKRVLEMIMKQEFINVDVTPYEDGFIGTGEGSNRIKAYGILKPIDTEFGRASKLLIVTAISPDEEISKKVVSSAKMME